MPGDVTTSVTAVVSVVDKATPAIAQITESLKGVEQVQKQINQTAAAGPAYPELAKMAQQNIWNLHVRGDDLVPDVSAAVATQAAKIGTTWERLRDKLSGIGTTIKTRLGESFESLVAVASRVGSALGTVFSGLGGFAAGYGVAGAVGAMLQGMNELVETVDKLGPVASNLGISIAELQRLTLWAKEGGVPVAIMQRSLQDLTRTMGGVNEGLKGFGKAEDAFKALGLLDDVTGQLKAHDAPELLRQLGPALAAISDPAERAATASAILGRSWKDMLPLIMEGPAAMDAAAEVSKKLGEIGPEAEAAALRLKRAQENFAAAMASLRMTIGEQLLPALTPAIEQLTEFIAANREAIGTVFEGAVTGLIGFFQTLGPYVKSTAQDMTAIKDAAQWIAEHMPGYKPPEIKAAEFTPIDPAEFMPPPNLESAWADPITHIRDLVEEALKSVERFFATISDRGDALLFDAIRATWEAIAAAIQKAADAWATFRGIKPEAWVAGSVPGVPPTAPPATATSTGGGPLTWETLNQQPSLIGPMGAPASGTVHVEIENKNPPPGTRTTATTTGKGVTADVGQSMPWSAPDYSGPWAPGGAPA
jgi:hypothetical protein